MEIVSPLEFLALVFWSGSVIFLTAVSAFGFYADGSKWIHFFMTRLSYEDGEKQSMLRGHWVFGWICAVAAVLILAHLHGLLSVSVWWYLADVAYLLLLQWICSRIFLLVIVIIERTWSFVVRGKKFWR